MSPQSKIPEGERMSFNIFLKLIVFSVLASIVLSACGGEPTPGATAAPAASQAPAATQAVVATNTSAPVVGEGEVDIIDWPGYVERGANDPNYDWVTQFEKDTGCKVKVQDAATSDEMVALMNQGGFDLV